MHPAASQLRADPSVIPRVDGLLEELYHLALQRRGQFTRQAHGPRPILRTMTRRHSEGLHWGPGITSGSSRRCKDPRSDGERHQRGGPHGVLTAAGRLGLAPYSSNASTFRASPNLTATCSGVKPRLSCTATRPSGLCPLDIPAQAHSARP
jgi:hypothetical protein